MLVAISDSAAIQGSLSDPDRFLPIFDRHYEAIVRYLRRRLPAADADDVAADVFLVAFRRRSTFDQSRGDVRTWLFGIATNALRNHRRAERRRLHALSLLERSVGAEPASPFGAAGPISQGAVGEALVALTESERDVLFLFACAELTYEEIANALEVPVGTVRSRLHRARLTLRDALQSAPVIDHQEVRCG